REERKSCWKARDAFYDCLDRAKILDGNSDEAKQPCSQLIRDFENACPSSWVDYFKTRRLLEARQKALLTNEA
ncbi:cytochrome c oxidase, subunit VIb, partial [Syncephalis fuscata]